MRRLRVENAAAAERGNDAAQTHNAEVRIDGHFGELRAERVCRVLRLLGIRFRIDLRFDRRQIVAMQQRRVRIAGGELLSAIQLDQLAFQLARDLIDGSPDRRRGQRSRRDRRLRQLRITVLESNGFERNAERFRGDLLHDRGRAHPHLVRAAGDDDIA